MADRVDAAKLVKLLYLDAVPQVTDPAPAHVRSGVGLPSGARLG